MTSNPSPENPNPQSLNVQSPNPESPAKEPEEWATRDEPATAAQRSYLETLAHDTGTEVPADLTKAHASELIDELRAASPRVPDSDA